MVLTSRGDKDITSENDITELEKGLDSHSRCSSSLTSLNFLNENHTDDNINSLDQSSIKVRNPKAVKPVTEDEIAVHHQSDSESSEDSEELQQNDHVAIEETSNLFQKNKALAQSMMDLALLSANANQLRYVIDSANTHPFYYASLTLISLSLFLQVALGFSMIATSHFNVKAKDKDKTTRWKIVHELNKWTVFGVFLLTALNVFITAFGISTSKSLDVLVKHGV